MQEKLRKFRKFRPIEQAEESGAPEADSMEFGSGAVRPGFNARAWWQFAITSIIKSFQFKRGAINAFKMRHEIEKQSESVFKEHLSQLYRANMDDKKRETYFARMEPATAKLFWHINSMVELDQLAIWVKDVVGPIEEARYKKASNPADPNEAKVGRMQSVRNWLFGRKSSADEEGAKAAAASLDLIEESKEGPRDRSIDRVGEDEDDLDEFFDCVNETELTDFDDRLNT